MAHYHGTPAQNYAMMRSPPERRGAIDYGNTHGALIEAGIPLPYIPPPLPFGATLVAREFSDMPALLALRRPSSGRNHIFKLHGYYDNHANIMDCIPCKLEEQIDIARLHFPGASRVVPNAKFEGPHGRSVRLVEFKTVGRPVGEKEGVRVSDVLSFRSNMKAPGQQLLRDLGPILVELVIEHMGPVEDILFLGCEHGHGTRYVTRFSLAYWLSYHLRALCENSLRLPTKEVDNLYLYSLYYHDQKRRWYAGARFMDVNRQ
ncbi:hypothetical protein C8R43DRAFT_1135751 [Mycena crocata]|nr:hypothetical protein C8R43DRAFT_1135751 [Mycena crocata]